MTIGKRVEHQAADQRTPTDETGKRPNMDGIRDMALHAGCGLVIGTASVVRDCEDHTS